MKKILCSLLFFLSLIFVLMFSNLYEEVFLQPKQSYENNIRIKEIKMTKAYLPYADLKYERYEPNNKCYLGHYVLANKQVDYNMNNYEKYLDKPSLIYVRHIVSGQEVSGEWLEQCIAQRKIPFLVVMPNDKNNLYNKKELDITLKSLKAYQVPMFIEIYPNPSTYNVTHQEYIDAFRKAYYSVSTAFDQSAIVWSISNENLLGSMMFYPGDDYIHWIGLKLIIKGLDYSNSLEDLSLFTELYQNKKPLAISQLAISNYSDETHKYHIEETEEAFKNIYNYIKQDDSRIKCVIYYDYDFKDAKGTKVERYSIITNKYLTEVFNEIIKSDFFINKIVKSYFGSKGMVLAYDVASLNYQGELYIDAKILEYDQKRYMEPENLDTISLNGLNLISVEKFCQLRGFVYKKIGNRLYFKEG